MRNIDFVADAWEEYVSWQNEDRKTLKKINKLLKEMTRTPETGEGQPEPLKNELSGKWSRRINLQDRLVYSFTDEMITVYLCRGHYVDK
ncbi:MAG: Txe/YoeB family addiction module toxin [Neisseriaceae bacterium]|nr:Txe/YoeB family addiction module toxin [Neisseriaceae bacterium]